MLRMTLGDAVSVDAGVQPRRPVIGLNHFTPGNRAKSASAV